MIIWLLDTYFDLDEFENQKFTILDSYVPGTYIILKI